MAKTRTITVQSMVGARTGEPAVMLKLGDQYVNLPPDDARKVGIDLIAGADRAEFEAKLVAVLRRDGMAEEGVGQVIALLRRVDEG